MRDVLIRSILAGAILCAPTLSANACNYYSAFPSYSYATPTYVSAPYVEQKVVVKKVAAVEYLAVPVAVPVYAIGYAPAAPVAAAPTAAPSAAPSPCDAQITELRQQLAEMKRLLAPQRPEPEYAPRPQQAPRRERESEREPRSQQPAPRSMFAAKCAGCHDSSASEKKGGKLSLFEFNAPLSLPADIAEKCIEEVRQNHMPKGTGKLTSREFAAVVCEIENLIQK